MRAADQFHAGVVVEDFDAALSPYWSYSRSGDGLRIELVSRTIESAFQNYWKTGRLG